MRYTTELHLHVMTDRSDDSFDKHTDEVLDALMDLNNVIDPDLTVNLSRRAVIISMIVEASDAGEAVGHAFTSVRAAIHQVGGWTPGWEDAIRDAVANSAPVGADDCVDA